MSAQTIPFPVERRSRPSRFLEGLPEEFFEHYDAKLDAPLEHEEAAAFGKALLDQLRGG